MSKTWDCAPWPIAPHCLPQGWDPDPEKWTERQKFARMVAQEIFNTLSANVYGLCKVKIRPCRKTCTDAWYRDPLRYAPLGVGRGPWVPVLHEGQVYNTRSCGCGGGSCGCSELCEIPLFPMVAEQTRDYTPKLEVRVDGKLLPPWAVRVDDRRRLIRVDGQCWPTCQQMGLPDTIPGTFSVAYETGTVVPLTVQMVLVDLMVHIYDSCPNQGGSCSSPGSFVRSIDRDGVSYEFDPITMYTTGKTGLPRVDMVLAMGNPAGSRTTFQAWSPDLVRHQRTTWETPMCQDYVHTQTAPAAVWTITHNQSCCPNSVWIEDPSGAPLLGADIDCEASNPSQVTITFGSPYAGKATLKF